jgi:hypothetical protein
MEVELFLSREESEVIAALKVGIGAGRLYDPPTEIDLALNQLRVAFDFDGVLADLGAERIYQSGSMESYRAHEVAKANQPLNPGPLHSVFMKLASIKSELTARRKAQFTPGEPIDLATLAKALAIDLTDANLIAASTESPEILFRADEKHLTEAGFTAEEAADLANRIRVYFSPIEIALVTARNPPVEERLMTTLKKWDVRLDQMYLMGGLPKEPVLREFKPHIFFDDTMKYIEAAKISVPAGWVPPFELQLETAVAPAASLTTSSPSPSAAVQVIDTVTVIDFEAACRKVFDGYMPNADRKKQPLDERFRDFIDMYKKRTPTERANILRRLQRYDLASLDHLVRKLKEIGEGPSQALKDFKASEDTKSS